MNHIMKKEIFSFSLFFLAITALLGAAGMFIIRGAYLNEIHTVQNIVGKVVVEYADTESAFLEALGDYDRQNVDLGAKILARYGYHEWQDMEKQAGYRHVIQWLFGVLSLFLIVSILSICVLFYRDTRRKKMQEEQILLLLEDCLSGNYQLIEDSKALKRLDNPLFADALGKLGKALKWKTKQLWEEHDNTKSLVTDISHQLKTPISALKVCLPLYEETENPKEKEEFYARCRLQIDKLEMLAAALVNISRLETHIIRLQPVETTLSHILTESVNSVYHKAVKKGISIENVSEEMDELNQIRLLLDEKWTIEALANVLDNAVKYSPEGSRVQIRISKLVTYLRVEIEDEGIGIPREEQGQIFRRFYRGSHKLVQKSEGTGVGLYLSRKILEEEGGFIFTRPGKEQGSVFIVQLPISFYKKDVL
ncbi:MAG: HAMP domain-containing histidine kinase [Muribaculaceae bacterium]|nr:HAMP domain-containing histidine kinase [Muribaculaceae bacterium]